MLELPELPELPGEEGRFVLVFVFELEPPGAAMFILEELPELLPGFIVELEFVLPGFVLPEFVLPEFVLPELVLLEFVPLGPVELGPPDVVFPEPVLPPGFVVVLPVFVSVPPATLPCSTPSLSNV